MGAIAMTKTDISDIYRDYIACLNKQDWPNLGKFVHQDVHYNGERIGCQVIMRCWSEIFARFRISILTSIY